MFGNDREQAGSQLQMKAFNTLDLKGTENPIQMPLLMHAKAG